MGAQAPGPAGPGSPPPPRTRGRPRDQDSAETRARIVKAAVGLFARHGYESTTNRVIAEAAGVTSSAIYHYFPSKAELYAAVYEAVCDRVFSAFEKAVVDHATLVDQYAAVLDAGAALNVADPTSAAFVVGVAGDAQRHPELEVLLRPMRRRNTEFFRRLVAAAATRGELADGVDRRAVEDLLNAVVSGLARLSAVTGDARRNAAAVDALQRFFAGTLLTT
ncbi:MAG: TetR/AcrR family transcriptional regulator [Ilumatobacteraceae bacterium]